MNSFRFQIEEIDCENSEIIYDGFTRNQYYAMYLFKQLYEKARKDGSGRTYKIQITDVGEVIQYRPTQIAIFNKQPNSNG